MKHFKILAIIISFMVLIAMIAGCTKTERLFLDENLTGYCNKISYVIQRSLPDTLHLQQLVYVIE